LEKPREEWDAYDLVTKNGIKIEVKSSAYLQSWKQNGFSKIEFGIKPTTVFDSDYSRTNEIKRQADVYVFCVLSHKDKATVNPLDLSQWDFLVLSTLVLDKEREMQKSITLSSLLKLKPEPAKYSELNKVINITYNNAIKL
jgi:hypothetical protein